MLKALISKGGAPFYCIRNSETKRDSLFMANYACFGISLSIPKPTAEYQEQPQINPDENAAYLLGTMGILKNGDSQRPLELDGPL